MKSKTLSLVSRLNTPGYDASNYRTERIWGTSKDGTQVPLTLLYKKGLEKNGRNPVWLTGYGAARASFDPFFSSERISLIDRGFIYGIIWHCSSQDAQRFTDQGYSSLNRQGKWDTLKT